MVPRGPAICYGITDGCMVDDEYLGRTNYSDQISRLEESLRVQTNNHEQAIAEAEQGLEKRPKQAYEPALTKQYWACRKRPVRR
jgi:hypothetical protein